MDFELTSEQEALRQQVRELAARFDDGYWAERDERHEFPWDFYNAFAAGGWLGIAIPEAYGGSGLGILEASLLLEEIATSGAAMNGCSALHLTIFGLNVLVKHGSEDQRQEVLPAAARGNLHVCFGVTEPNAGTDTSRISTFARRAGPEYILNGQKVWTTKAGDSQKMLLLARTTPRAEVEKPTDGLTLFLIDTQGLPMRAIPKMGRNA